MRCGRGVVGGMSAAPPAISDSSVMRNCRWGCIGNVTIKRDHSANRRMRSPPKRGVTITKSSSIVHGSKISGGFQLSTVIDAIIGAIE